MADNRSVSPGAAHATGRSSSFSNNAPPGYGLRRSKTVDETAYARRRSSLNPGSGASSFIDAQRRDSTFSEFSHNNPQEDTDGLWNLGKMASDPPEQGMAATLPLVLALLPAVGGLFFEGGSTFFTHVILLGLAAIVLRWSVTQPWNWYHAAQEVRVAKETALDTPVFETDSDMDLSAAASVTTAFENVPEEDEKRREPELNSPEPRSSSERNWEKEREDAKQGLRKIERIALAWCFIFPLLAAYLLHKIRGQMSLRSEGLISDYNLHIFVIAAEVRPISHFIRLLHSSTVHRQRIVATNPYEQQEARDQQLQELYAKIEELESRLSAGEATTVANAEHERVPIGTIEDLVTRNYRERVQPEVDSVTRAMRRYEKKLSNIIDQIDIRLEYLDQRSNDAIALAATAARQKNSQGSVIPWMVEQTTAIILLPFQTAFAVFTFPFRTVSSLLGRSSRSPSEKSHKKGRRSSGSSRLSSERLSTRVSKK